MMAAAHAIADLLGSTPPRRSACSTSRPATAASASSSRSAIRRPKSSRSIGRRCWRWPPKTPRRWASRRALSDAAGRRASPSSIGPGSTSRCSPTSSIISIAPACVRLLQKTARSLKAAAGVVMLEFVPNEDRVSPPMAAAFKLTMLAGTPAGDAYTLRRAAPDVDGSRFHGVAAHPRPGSGDGDRRVRGSSAAAARTAFGSPDLHLRRRLETY